MKRRKEDRKEDEEGDTEESDACADDESLELSTNEVSFSSTKSVAARETRENKATIDIYNLDVCKCLRI